MEQDQQEPAEGEGEGEVTKEDVERLQEAHSSDPTKSRDSAAELNKPSDPSLNDRDAPVAKGTGSY